MIKKWNTVEDFCELTSKGERTIREYKRKWMKNENTRNLVRTDKRPHKLHRDLLKEALGQKRYNQTLECMENKKYVQRLKNTIDRLSDDEDRMAKWLFNQEWTHFFTFAFANVRSRDACFDIMTRYHEQLKEEAGKGVKLFFNTEGQNEEEYHVHGMIRTTLSDTAIRKAMRKTANTISADVQEYDPYQSAAYYANKTGVAGVDWDFYGEDQ